MTRPRTNGVIFLAAFMCSSSLRHACLCLHLSATKEQKPSTSSVIIGRESIELVVLDRQFALAGDRTHDSVSIRSSGDEWEIVTGCLLLRSAARPLRCP